MRRRAWAVTAALGTVLVTSPATLCATVASAAPSPAPLPVPSPSPGTVQCTVDKELGGITGLTATANGYAVTVKATSGLALRVYLLDAECRRSGKSLAYNADRGARDPQDIQVAADGTFWVADTGDDPANPARPNVGVWKILPDGRATLYRFTYPDRPQAAQALLINGDGNPVIITDNPRGPAGIYVPGGPLDPTGHATALKHAGDFTPQQTGTENKLSKIGMTRVTGAANSHDGKHVAIRTYSDAYEWGVTNGDVLGAITTGTPKITPLPNEPQGSAIAYSRDNANFLTVSDVDKQQGAVIQILRYRPSPPAANPAQAAPAIASKGDTRSWLDKWNLQDFLRVIGGVGVLGLLMVIGGVVGIRRARRKGATAAARRRSSSDNDPETMNSPTSAMAQVSGYPPPAEPPGSAYRSRGYGNGSPYEPPADRYPDPDDRYPGPPGAGVPPGGGMPPAGPAPGPFPSGPGGLGGLGGLPPGASRSAPPSNPGRRGDRGVARSHRPANRRGPRDNGDPGRRGYSDQHEGFGDILE